MQENNFEKQVQHKLDELQLRPSEPVWQNIEATLKKKKERRLVFWLLPLFIITAGLIWWHQAAWHNQNTAKQILHKIKQQAPQTFSKPHVDVLTPKTILRHAQDNKHAESSLKKTNAVVETKSSNRKGAMILEKVSKQQAQKLHFSESVVSKKQDENSRTSLAMTTKNIAVKKPVKTAEHSQSSIAEKLPTTVVIQDTIQEKDSAATDSVETVLKKVNKIHSNKKRVQWNIVSRIGSSNAKKPLLATLGLKSAREFYGNNDYVGNTPGTSSPGSMARLAPATPISGLQFSIGALAKKSIGKNSFLIAGLNYGFYSYHLAIGSELPADSVEMNRNLAKTGLQKAFHNNGTFNQFTNSFHYIELPVGIEYRLFKKVPLHVQHSLILRYLIASKALQYDYASDNYYQRSDGLRKINSDFFTALNYSIWKSKSLSLQAGPYVQYGLQAIFKKTSNRHMLSGGLSINMGF